MKAQTILRHFLVGLCTAILVAPSAPAAEDSQTLPLGPIGASGRLSANSNLIRVTALTAGAPGNTAGLLVNDYIHGAFGEEFGLTGGSGITGAELDLGMAIERAEANGGQLPLRVMRAGLGDMTLTVNLPAVGGFGPAYPLNSAKYTAAYNQACQSLHESIQGWTYSHGGARSFEMSWAAIALLGHPNWNDSSGAKPYRNSINKVRDGMLSMINAMIYAPVEDKLFDGSANPNYVETPVQWENWKFGGAMIFLSQYRLKTGDTTVDDELQRAAEMIANRIQWWKQPALGTSYSPAGSEIAGMVSHSGVTGDYIHGGWGGGINICGSQNFSGLAAAKRAGVNMTVRPKDGHYFGYATAPTDSVAIGMENYNHTLTEKFDMCWEWMVGPCGGWSAGDFEDGHVCYTKQGWSSYDAAGRTAASLFGQMLSTDGGTGLNTTNLDRVSRMKGYLIRNYARLQECHAYTHGGQVYYQLCMPYFDDRGQRYVLDNWRAHHNLSRQPNGTLAWVPGRNMTDSYMDLPLNAQVYVALAGTVASGGLPHVPAYNTNRLIADFKSPWLKWPALAARYAKITSPSQPFQVDVCNGSGSVLAPGSYTAAWTHLSGPATATFSNPAAATTTVSFPKSGRYRIQLAATSGGNNLTEPIDIDVSLVAPPASYTQGYAGYQVYTNISGTAVTNLTSAAKYPAAPDAVGTLTSLEGTFSGDNYGQRLRGFIIPPATGNYRFYLSSNEASQFIFNSAGPAETSTVAINLTTAVTKYTWTAHSAVFALTAGQPYFFDVLHKEGSGSDHVAVAWTNDQGITTPTLISGDSLAIGANAAIVRQPLPRTATPGGSADFEVLVSGSGPFLYQWRLNGVAYWGQSSSSKLALVNISTGAVGDYDCVITTPAGVLTSTPATLTLDASYARLSGGLKREVWSGLGGSAITDLTGNANYPLFPTSTGIVTAAESGENYGDSYGQKLRGWLKPPVSGKYKFFMATDDSAQLWLSTDDSAANLVKIVDRTSYNNFRAYSAGGQSAGIELVAGRRYYLEILHKEGGGGDHVSVAWQPPGEPVPANGATPIDGVYLEYEMVVAQLADQWRLDETSGTTATNAVRPLNGTHTSGPLVNQAGATAKTGRSTYYDGSNDRSAIPAPNYNTNNLTLLAWVKRNGTVPAWAPILFCRAGNTAAGFGCGDANAIRYHWNGNQYNDDFGLTLPDSEWVLLAMVVQPTGTTIHMRTASGLQSVTKAATLSPEEFDGELNIGADTSQIPRRFKGWIDDVRIYKSALAATDIEALYSAAFNSPPQIQSTDLSIMENSVTGSTVGTVTATDPDPGQALAYSIVGGNIGNRFAISATTGAITTTGALDHEGIDTFILTILVSDNASTPATTTAPVTINVTNMANDDSDADGLSDDWEVIHFGGTVAQTGSGDADNDGVSNSDEFTAGLDPNLTDSDSDSYGDILERAAGSDPLLASSVPDSSYANLLAWWRMNETTGSRSRDWSGRSNHATLMAGTWAAGREGNCLSLNGTSDYATAPAAACAGLSTQLTIAFWAYGNAALLPRQTSAIYAADAAGNRVINLHLPWSDGSIYYDAGNSGTSTFDRITKAASATDYEGKWTHWAFTKNSTTGEMKIYLNGVLWHSGTGMTRTFPAIASVKIGDGAAKYAGSLDDLRIYGSALNATQIAAIINPPPSLANAAFTVPENSPLATSVGTITASDPESQPLTYSITAGNSAGRFAINATTGLLSVANSLNFEGTSSYSLTVRATDNGSPTQFVQAAATITIANVNEGPAFAVNPIVAEATEDSAFNSQLSATDPDTGDTLTYAILTGPDWLAVSNTGALSGTPTNGHVGANTFTVRVTDAAGLFAAATLNLTVANTNDAPAFAANPIAAEATEDSAFSSQLSATDPDTGDTLTYAILTGPDWLAVSNTGALTGTPTNGHVGANTFTVRVTDAAGLLAAATLNLTVANTNDAPAFAANPIVAEATEDSAFNSQLSATDPDTGDTLTYAILTGPDWLAVSNTGALSGTPTNGHVGANTFTVRVTDAAGLLATATLNLTVANTNDAPAFAVNPIVADAGTQDVGYSGSLTGTASDVDAGDTLSYSKLAGPDWLQVATNGTLSGTPHTGDTGSQSFTIQASDSQAEIATAALTIQVAAVNSDANGNGMLDSWESAHFGNAAPGANPPDADPDHDGICNLMEYALDTPPLTGNPLPLSHHLETVAGQTYLRLIVPKNPAASNLNFTVETTGILNDWSGSNTVIEVDSSNQLIARDAVATTDSNRRFIRLKVSTKP